jgi:hypothetical protein
MTKRLLLIGLVFCLLPLCASAQSGFTSVTGQVKDPNNVLYANCSVTANFVDATGPTTRAATINGSPIPSRTIQTSCDANGNFTIVVEDSAVVVPAGTTWQFTFSYTQHTTGLPNPAGQPQSPSFSYTAPTCPNAGCITGASISITSAISSLAPLTPFTNVTFLTKQVLTGVLTGNGTDQTLFSYPLQGGLLGTQKGVRITIGVQHSSGSNNPTFKLFLGGTLLWSKLDTAASNNNSLFLTQTYIFNFGALNSNIFWCGPFIDQTTILSSGVGGVTAIDTSMTQTVLVTGNVASPDQISGSIFLVELIQ